MAYGSIDSQASPTNVKNTAPASGGGKADVGMGDIDEYASPSGPSSPNNPDNSGRPIGSIDHANFGGINSIVNVSMAEQCPGSTVTIDNAAFNDDVAQYRKGGLPPRPHLEELNRVRNQAFNAVGETQDNSKDILIGRQDSDPKGG